MSTWALKIILIRCGTHCITRTCMGPMLDLRSSGLGGPVKTSTVPASHKDGVFNNGTTFITASPKNNFSVADDFYGYALLL